MKYFRLLVGFTLFFLAVLFYPSLTFASHSVSVAPSSIDFEKVKENPWSISLSVNNCQSSGTLSSTINGSFFKTDKTPASQFDPNDKIRFFVPSNTGNYIINANCVTSGTGAHSASATLNVTGNTAFTSPPSNFRITGVSDIRIMAAWDALTGAERYEITYTYNNNGTPTTVTVPRTNQESNTTVAIDHLSPTTEYTLAVKGCNSSSCSPEAQQTTTTYAAAAANACCAAGWTYNEQKRQCENNGTFANISCATGSACSANVCQSASGLPTNTPVPATPSPTSMFKPGAGPCAKPDASGCISFPTAIGNINTTPGEFIKGLFGILLSLAGGVALVMIIYSGYRIMMSQGNKEGLQAARDTMTAAIVGLLFLIFSMVILQIIGVDILNLPNFRIN